MLATFVAFGISWAGADDGAVPPVLDLVAPAFGLFGLLGLAAVTGGAYWLATLRLLSGAVFLGAITDAMLLGHWYLVQPGLARAPLEGAGDAVPVRLADRGGRALPAAGDDRRAERLRRRRLRRAARLDVGRVRAHDDRARLGDPAALREQYYSAVMAATGLLYLAILTAFGTDVVARALLTP